MHRFDKDGDGAITRDEFFERVTTMAEKKPERIKALKVAAARQANPKSEAEAESECMAVASQCFKALDQDNQGHLGLAEVQVIMQVIRPSADTAKALARFDKDGDSKVSEDEFKQRIKEMAVTMFEKDNNFDMAHAYEKLKVTMEKKLEAFLPPVTTVTAAAPGAKTSVPPKRGCDCTIS